MQSNLSGGQSDSTNLCDRAGKTLAPPMERRFAFGMRLLLLFLSVLASGAAAVAGDLLLVNATVIPSPDQPALPHTAVLIREGRIAEIGPREQMKVPAGIESIDCRGKFITAGFWNCHVHLITPDLLRAREAAVAQLDGALEAMFTRWGFT